MSTSPPQNLGQNWTWEQLFTTWTPLSTVEYRPSPGGLDFKIFRFFMNPNAYWTSGDVMPLTQTLQSPILESYKISEARIVKEIPFLGGLSIKGGKLHGIKSQLSPFLHISNSKKIPRGDKSNFISNSIDSNTPLEPFVSSGEGGTTYEDNNISNPGYHLYIDAITSWLFAVQHFLPQYTPIEPSENPPQEMYYPSYEFQQIQNRKRVFRDIIFRFQLYRNY